MKKISLWLAGVMYLAVHAGAGPASFNASQPTDLSDVLDPVSYSPGQKEVTFLDSTLSAGSYLLNYMGSIDTLNASVSTFRMALKAWYGAKSLFGFKSYAELQKDYLYPPQGAVSQKILSLLSYFNTKPVVSAGVSEVIPGGSSAIRNDSDLGRLEKNYLTGVDEDGIPIHSWLPGRLDFVKSILTGAKEGQYFLAPDTAMAPNTNLYGYYNETPYAYALDRGLSAGAQAPRIAVCYSGGGFRAMIATLGFWQALSDTGIVNSITYTANLSGSTWCSMPWSMGATLKELQETYEAYAKVGVGLGTVSDISKYIAPHINTNYIKHKLTAAFLYDQPLSSIRGLYAPLLAQMTLASWDKKGQSSQYTYLWQALAVINDPRNRPFPIATALIPYTPSFDTSIGIKRDQQRAKNGLWMEFNPDYVGFEYLNKQGQLTGAWIPSFALGRTFEKVTKPQSWWQKVNIFSSAEVIGVAAAPAAMQTVDYWEGTWGSAYTVSPGDIFRIFFKQNVSGDEKPGSMFDTANTTLQGITDENSLQDRMVNLLGSIITVPLTGSTLNNLKEMRLFPAKYNNFALFDGSPITDSTFTAVDAGIDYNLPFPPLLRPGRAIDLIIVGDWSEQGNPPAKELLLAEAWAIARKVPFPCIAGSAQYKGVATRAATLFNYYPKGAKRGPAILYIPLIDNQYNAPGFSVADCFKGACSTFNFDYRNAKDPSNSYVKQLAQHTYRTLWGIYPQLREVVQNLVDATNQNTPFTMQSLSSVDALLQKQSSLESMAVGG